MTSAPSSRKKRRNLDLILLSIACVTIVVAWIVGLLINGRDVEPYLSLVLPEATRFERTADGIYAAYIEHENPGDELIGYVAVAEATGYGGPLQLAVGVDANGQIIGVNVLEHTETTSFFKRVQRAKFFEDLLGKSYDDSFTLSEDVDAVSGATYTSRAILEAARNASRDVADTALDFDVPAEPPPTIQFGIPEVLLIALFAAGFVAHRRKFKHKKVVRWGTMIVGLVGLGFVFNMPLTLGKISAFLMGYWPQWQTNLYWYLLLGGILFILIIDNKNSYCEWFCPFGAAQECMGVTGGAKPYQPYKGRKVFPWIQRGLAWLAIVVALLFRNPSLSSYEIFGTLFNLTGSGFQFVVLTLILITALIVRRPWCNYLCPIRPVIDAFRLVRRESLKIWQKITKQPV